MINLMTLDDIANMLKMSRKHVRDVVTKTKGFPEPVPGSGSRKPRWTEDAVREFFTGKSAQISHTAR